MLFYIYNLYSIFTIGDRDNLIGLIKYDGKVLKQWFIPDTIGRLYGFWGKPLLATKNKLFVPISHPTTSNLLNKREFKKLYSFPVDYLIDISDSIYVHKGRGHANYSEEYLKDYYYSQEWYRTMNDNGEMVYAFGLSNNLFVYNNGFLIKTVPVKSNYWKDNEPFPLKKKMDYNYIAQYLTSQSRYGKIIYDPYRKIYYRIVRHAGNYENKDGTINRSIDNSWSIIVLDNNFVILGEHKFPPQTYKFYEMIVVKEGLLISNNHKLNPLYDLQKLSWSLFKVIFKNEK